MNVFIQHPLHHTNILQGVSNLAREIVEIVNQGVESVATGNWPQGFEALITKRYACAMLDLNPQNATELGVCRILVTYAIHHKACSIITVDDIRAQNLIRNVPDIINLQERVTQIEGTLQHMQQMQQRILDGINALNPAIHIVNNG